MRTHTRVLTLTRRPLTQGLHERATLATTSQVTTTPDFVACHIFWPFRPRGSSSEFRAAGRRQAILEGREKESERGGSLLASEEWGKKWGFGRLFPTTLVHRNLYKAAWAGGAWLQATKQCCSEVYSPEWCKKRPRWAAKKNLGCLSRSKLQVQQVRWKKGVPASAALMQLLTMRWCVPMRKKIVKVICKNMLKYVRKIP